MPFFWHHSQTFVLMIVVKELIADIMDVLFILSIEDAKGGLL